MNRITATLTATIAVIGFSACTAQQRQMVDNVIEDEAPAEVVVVETMIGDPAPQGSCLAGEQEINGVCLPRGTDTPPPTQPPSNEFTCPAGEVIDVDPSPHCIIEH